MRKYYESNDYERGYEEGRRAYLRNLQEEKQGLASEETYEEVKKNVIDLATQYGYKVHEVKEKFNDSYGAGADGFQISCPCLDIFFNRAIFYFNTIEQFDESYSAFIKSAKFLKEVSRLFKRLHLYNTFSY